MKQAPDFKLQDQDGKWHNLSDYNGRWLVLYFYPKDDTPGCTTEACSFRDEREDIERLGKVDVVGISKDSVDSHKKFSEKYHLNFTLLSDPDHQTIAAYDSWRQSKLASIGFLGTQRNTFIVSPDGYIVKEYKGVDPKQHSSEIIRDLSELMAA